MKKLLAVSAQLLAKACPELSEGPAFLRSQRTSRELGTRYSVLGTCLLLIAYCLLPAALRAATGDITAVRMLGTTCTAASLACNGWVAEIDISGLATGGSYSFGNLADPANYATTAKGSVTCTSPTYDTTGTAGTGSRTVYMTHALRKPFPNQATMDETAGATMTIRVSLSDDVFSADTSCAATIQSGLYTAS